MSLVEKMTAVIEQKKAAARGRYFAAIRNGDAEAAVTAAEAAGVPVEKVSADAGVLEKAQALAVEAGKLAQREKSAATTEQAAQAAAKALDDAIARLQPVLDEAQFCAGVADRELTTCRAAVVELAGLSINHPELLPAAKTPAPVRAWLADQAEEKNAENIENAAIKRRAAAHRTLVALLEEVDRIRAGREPLNRMWRPADYEGTNRENLLARLNDEIEAAKKELDRADEKLAAAQPSP
jgi:hypothetical protein